MKQRNNVEKRRRKNHAKRGYTQYLKPFKEEKKKQEQGARNSKRGNTKSLKSQKEKEKK